MRKTKEHPRRRGLVSVLPSAIKTDYVELSGVYPEAKPETTDDLSSVVTDPDNFVNYAGVEDDPDVREVIQGFIKDGFRKSFDSSEKS